MEENTKKLSALGLSSQKIQETLKNNSLTTVLIEISDEAGKHGTFNKMAGILLYNLGTKLPKQFHEHLPLLIEYVVKSKLNSEAKLSAAIKFVQDNAGRGVNTADLDAACGVGVEISDEEISSTVESLISKNQDAILTQRYHYNIGPLLGQAKILLKWADNRKVKEKFDEFIEQLLGPKTEEDLKKPSKIKERDPVKRDSSLKSKSPPENGVEEEKSVRCTMAEFLKTIQFHNPGENYKTDGYVICAKTHELLKKHLKITNGQVRTRFPPEPNGILHIGHAKAININFGYAASREGVCLLRYDDTNPEKEEEKFFIAIKEMVEWLGYKPAKITHSSDYFDQLFEWAELLVRKGLAYVCHQKPEDVRGHDPPPSPWRDRDCQESLRLFHLMRNGYFDEGEATLRLKVTLEEGKVDPVAYRIKYTSHHRTKDKWCVYPTYDYTHCLCDSIEHITHSLCTKEFQNRRSSYYWLCNSLEIYCPVQWEYGRLNMLYSVVSKRKIGKLIESGIVRDWDDPRLFTLTALRRRGVPAEAINNFCASLGLTGALIAIHPDALDAAVREVLNVSAIRTMVILEPLRVVITNFPYSSPRDVTVPNIPGQEDAGSHVVFFDKDIWIEKSDFKEIGEKGFRRFSPTQPVGLRHCGYILKLSKVIYDDHRQINYLEATCEAVSLENKPKAFVHWVSRPLKCEVRLYDKLFLHKNPEDSTEVPGGFLSDVNPNSLTVVRDALIDESLKSAKIFDKFQFERIGFFSVDPDSKPKEGRLVFNRVANLKEDKGK